jgi:dethiobiotin synthetase
VHGIRRRRAAGGRDEAGGLGLRGTPDGLRNEDALALQAAMNVRASYADVNPFAFEPAIAPHIAAAEAGGPSISTSWIQLRAAGLRATSPSSKAPAAGWRRWTITRTLPIWPLAGSWTSCWWWVCAWAA